MGLRHLCGVRQKSVEFWVANEGGIHKARSVRRIAVQDRWTQDSVKWVKYVPWNRYKDQQDADGDIPEEAAVNVEPRRTEDDARGPEIVVKTRQVPPRAFQIRKEDAERHGYSRGCPGCSSWFRGLGRQPHMTECLDRFAGLMKAGSETSRRGRRSSRTR